MGFFGFNLFVCHLKVFVSDGELHERPEPFELLLSALKNSGDSGHNIDTQPAKLNIIGKTIQRTFGKPLSELLCAAETNILNQHIPSRLLLMFVCIGRLILKNLNELVVHSNRKQTNDLSMVHILL